MKVILGISNRHIHLNEKILKILFGDDYKLTKIKDLTQTNEYACHELVTIKTDKDKIENVRVLGPIRDYTQVEISKTDAYKLGINPPIRNSGDLDNSEKLTIIGPNDEITLENCCIVASRHLHLSYDDIKKYNLENVNKLKAIITTEKKTILENIYLKPGIDSVLELHLDTDDANSCLLNNKDIIEIVKDDN